MTKYKVAFTGVFDIANYGDLLFPVVFEKAMQNFHMEIELFLFSPTEGPKALDEKTYVHALKDLERLHQSEHFDCIIVGGGALIHFNKLYQVYPNQDQFKEYNIYETWVLPSLVALKYGVKLLWNVPGVPFPFEEQIQPFVNALCGCVNYLSVRDDSSKQKLLPCLPKGTEISVFPDSVLSVNRYIKAHYLSDVRKSIIDLDGKYVVFHCNRHIKQDEISLVLKSLTDLKAKGYLIVLLPLAYTHHDEIILSQINELSNNSFILPTKELSIIEMMSILAGCDLYIGISFHGMITSMAYGKKAIGYNYLGYDKSQELFRLVNREQYYIETADKLDETIEQILSDTSSIDIFTINDRIQDHFATIKKWIEESNIPHTIDEQCLSQLSEGLSRVANTQNELKYLRDQLDWYQKDNADLRKRLSDLYSQFSEQSN